MWDLRKKIFFTSLKCTKMKPCELRFKLYVCKKRKSFHSNNCTPELSTNHQYQWWHYGASGTPTGSCGSPCQFPSSAAWGLSSVPRWWVPWWLSLCSLMDRLSPIVPSTSVDCTEEKSQNHHCLGMDWKCLEWSEPSQHNAPCGAHPWHNGMLKSALSAHTKAWSTIFGWSSSYLSSARHSSSVEIAPWWGQHPWSMVKLHWVTSKGIKLKTHLYKQAYAEM